MWANYEKLPGKGRVEQGRDGPKMATHAGARSRCAHYKFY